MKTKFLHPLPLRGEQAPLIVHVAKPKTGARSPMAFGEVRFAQYVSIFEQGRPPIRRSASDGMAEHIEHWRRQAANIQDRIEERVEDEARQTVWRMIRRALWQKIKKVCCCGLG